MTLLIGIAIGMFIGSWGVYFLHDWIWANDPHHHPD